MTEERNREVEAQRVLLCEPGEGELLQVEGDNGRGEASLGARGRGDKLRNRIKQYRQQWAWKLYLHPFSFMDI